MRLFSLFVALIACGLPGPDSLAGVEGYYRQPALARDRVVFVAEGDLWRVPAVGGLARRLTRDPGDESSPELSADGQTLAFIGRYEGPRELYTMPMGGGLPTRRSYGLTPLDVTGFAPGGDVLVATDRLSTLPSWQLVTVPGGGPGAGVVERIPLAQASDGTFDAKGRLFFTRLPFQGSHTKRYRGGTAQQIWRWDGGGAEAVLLTADYPGTSKRPMAWDRRIYFVTDRDGTMNLWSMDGDGGDLQQHTRHEGLDVKGPDLDSGRIVYQLGADLRIYDIAADRDRPVPITLDSDLDQTRERWVDEPFDYLSAWHLSPDGGRVVLTARGKVFVAPHGDGRLVQTGRATGVRYRDARFMPGGSRLLTLGDESGEVELWTLPADGIGAPQPLTAEGTVLRWEAVPSPDGKRIAHRDKGQRLWIVDVETKENRLVAETPIADYSGLAWSPDSRYLAFVEPAPNLMARVFIHDVEDAETFPVTSDRFDSFSPSFSADGRWLYLLSDRNLRSVVPSPWGSYQPEPFLDKKTQLFHIALVSGLRSPFAPKDELLPKEEKDEEDEEEEDPPVEIDFEGIVERIERIELAPGNYAGLTATEQALFFVESPADGEPRIRALKIADDGPEPETVVEGARGYEISADGKKLLFRKGDALYIVDAQPLTAELEEAKIDLSGWALSVIPREEWRQMFVEAWRLERDYFYDPDLHGVDWPAMLEKYLPLVDRVTTRAELSDLIAQMVGELSALHIFVRGGDLRRGEDDVQVGYLGARLARDQKAGGYRIEQIYPSDPDQPDRRSPLSAPRIAAKEGDVILTINGVPTLSVEDPGRLLRHQAGRQLRLRLGRKKNEPRDVIVVPIGGRAEADLRYHGWEYGNRLAVEDAGAGELGYVHLRAMGGRNFTEWARNFYPVFNRKGLIIDVRHNRGGNIDSWILGRLLRKAWFHWSQHAGQAPIWNMQYAFRGHIAVLVNERTASDGEAFAEGIKRLDLGTVIGTRTWGGEIWLSSSNFLVDGGIATSAEFGVFGPEGTWLIEGHGVDPDVVVDNLPRSTFDGKDAQLEAAIDFLKKKIAEEPVEIPETPEHPDKSFRP